MLLILRAKKREFFLCNTKVCFQQFTVHCTTYYVYFIFEEWKEEEAKEKIEKKKNLINLFLLIRKI